MKYSKAMWPLSVLGACIATLCVGGTGLAGTEDASKSPAAAAPTDEAKKASIDMLILKSGKSVEGKILEETETSVKIEVRVGTIVAQTTYAKSEILEIKRAVETNKPMPDSKAANTPGAAGTSKSTKDKKDKEDKDARLTPTGDENAKKIYFVELKGAMNIDFTKTPLERLFEDVEKVNPDVVVIKMDASATRVDVDTANSIFSAENSGPPIEKAIVENKRRVVFWIERAQGGAALLPFVSQDIYFTSEGWMGGAYDLDEFSSGDKMVDEKLISARLGHMEGFLVKGDYEPKLVKAMMRAQYWLAVKFEGGEPIYKLEKPTDLELAEGWIVLTDDGKGSNKDKTRVGGKGDDTLTLNAEWAERLGISDGTADTLDQLADQLGIGSNYTVLKDTKGGKALKEWTEGANDALSKIRNEQIAGFLGIEFRGPGSLWVELSEVKAEPDDEDGPRTEMSRRLSIMRQISSVVGGYAEVFDGDGGFRAQLNVRIEELKQGIASYNKAKRESARTRN